MKEVVNFANSFYNHARDGFKKVEDSIYNNRIDICKSCEYFDSEDMRCKNCGCFLDIKASWNSEKCPIDKW